MFSFYTYGDPIETFTMKQKRESGHSKKRYRKLRIDILGNILSDLFFILHVLLCITEQLTPSVLKMYPSSWKVLVGTIHM